jgi:hypothetical protein
MNPGNMMAIQKAAAGGDEQAIALLPEKERARVVRDTQGKVVGMARTPEDAQKVTESQSVKADFQANLDRLIAIRSESPLGVVPTTAKEGRSLASQLRIQIGKMAQLGALSGADLDIISAQIPENPFGVEQWGLAERLKQMKDQTEEAYQRNLRSRMQDFSPASQWKKVGPKVGPAS